MKLAIPIGLLAFVCMFAGSVYGKSPINKSLIGGIAIKGYDAVGYFTAGKPVKGSKKFHYEYLGATWRFSSEDNLHAFKADPEKYAPQYGGYCAWAVSQGDTATIDPQSWKIVSDKLYLNYSRKIQKKWEENQTELINRADENWPDVLD